MANPQNPGGHDPRKQQGQESPNPQNPGAPRPSDNRQQSQQGEPQRQPDGRPQHPQQAHEGAARGQEFRNRQTP